VPGLRIGSFQYLDGSIRSEQGPASRHDDGMVVDDQYPHDDLVHIRTAVVSSSCQDVASATMVQRLRRGGSLPMLFGGLF
jgi:hypothetical protein